MERPAPGPAPPVLPVVDDYDSLLSHGVVRVPIPLTLRPWADVFLAPCPMNDVFSEGSDNEYAFYRNILVDFLQEGDEDSGEEKGTIEGDRNVDGGGEEENSDGQQSFPFRKIYDALWSSGALTKHFGIMQRDDLRLDDAFCIHYDTAQHDTRCAKHMDPSDITVNICLRRSPDAAGSQIIFYGRARLENADEPDPVVPAAPLHEKFLVDCVEGTATLHYGSHPHETSPLEGGCRTNVIMTYCYTDESRSGGLRTCYDYGCEEQQQERGEGRAD